MVVNSDLRAVLEFHDDGEPLIENLVYRPMGQAPHNEVVDLAVLPRVTLIRNIVARRLELAGYPRDFASPHGLRSGFLTQAALDGAPLAAAMQLSLHRSASQAQRYYADVEIADNPTADLLG